MKEGKKVRFLLRLVTEETKNLGSSLLGRIETGACTKLSRCVGVLRQTNDQ